MKNLDKYAICKLLDQEKRIIGLPLDEFIPALVIGIFFLISGVPILSVFVGAAWVFALRLLKKGQGSGFLLRQIFWFSPSAIFKFLTMTPASFKRHWFR